MMKMPNALQRSANQAKTAKNTTAQTKAAKTGQVKNNAGGFVFQVTDKVRLERFLILGTDKGSYYQTETALTDANIAFVKEFIRKDVRMVVDTTVAISEGGRAYRNSPALFVMAMALTFAEDKDKPYVRENFNKVVRTSTHLFETAEYVDSLGGWGAAKRKAFSGWYESKDAKQLAYQAVKYRQRNGWTHRDVLRLSHAQPASSVAEFMVGKEISDHNGSPVILTGFTDMQAAGSAKDVIRILNKDMYKNLPWETIPTEFLKDPEVWKTLFYNGQLNGQALLRNITRLAKIGAFNDVKFAGDYAIRLADAEQIVKNRVHPIGYLNAMGIYRNGQMTNQGMYGSRTKTWATNGKIVDALESGVYSSFATITPAGTRNLLAIDTSGSMTWWGPAGLAGMDCREAAAAMAMITARVEPYVEVIGFGTSSARVEISSSDSFDAVQKKIDRMPGYGTDLSQPMEFAMREKASFDSFSVYTDNETYAGRSHPFQALKRYRSEYVPDARLAVVGMTATPFTVADPSDRGMMDFVGFDSSAPAAMAEFFAGRL